MNGSVPVNESVLVIGAGLLGASIGLGMRALGRDVLIEDSSPTAARVACDLGAGRPAGEDEPDPKLVVVAAPPDVAADVVVAALRRFSSAIVTDVTSVKGSLTEAVSSADVDVSRYVGGHPMAGRERSGAVAARGDLFVGRPWVLTPTPETAAEAVQRVRSLVVDLQGVPVVMSPGEHDEAVALVSHVPQLAASLVAARLSGAPQTALDLTGQGLRDVTRIAASDPHLWVQILAGNPGPVAEVLRAVRDDLESLLGQLDRLAANPDAAGARGELAKALDAGVRGQARIPGKHGQAPTPLSVVTVQVSDRPGEISRVLLAMGDAGINLEDLRLEHVPGRLVGLAEISVLPSARDQLERMLLDGGWSLAG